MTAKKSFLALALVFVILLCGCDTTEKEKAPEHLGEVTVTINDGRQILADAKIEIFEEDTAFSTLRDCCLASGLELEDSAGIVTRIGNKANMADGPLSGWLFLVNGEVLMTGPMDYKVSDKDVIEWQFITDFNEYFS